MDLNSVVRNGIKPFCGQAYSDWEFRITLLLEENDCMEALEKGETESNTKNYKKKCSKAKSLIVQNISDSYLEYVKDCTTAWEMLERLKNNFERKSLSERVHLKKELTNLKYDGKSSLSTHFLKFDTILKTVERHCLSLICNGRK
uniref:Copia protein n=1 Tax=Cacopsylla melanoneura TaxID=428564 RepID=A0A8D8X811_9HEMI